MSSHVFGPVPSRRLGRSLGVDVVPLKMCTFDCIYCQLGRTTCRATDRKEFVPLQEVLDELKGKLDTAPDYITLSGSGEPTLYLRLGELIDAVKRMTDVPVAILTNGSLLWMPEVRLAVAKADLVVPSLDAGDERMFNYVNRPDPSLNFERIVEGLIAMRKETRGQYWLEVLLLGGVTAVRSEAEKIAKIVRRIKPDRVHINTATRPSAEDFAYAAAREKLEELAPIFGDNTEVIADYADRHARRESSACSEDVLEMIARRPCTVQDIAAGLGIHLSEAVKCVEELSQAGKLEAESRDGVLFYKTSAEERRGR